MEKQHTHTEWDISVLQPRRISIQGDTEIPNYTLNSWGKTPISGACIRSLTSCRQQRPCAPWQSSLLAAPSSLWPRGGPSDHISSSSSCHFTCVLKNPCPRSDLGSFWETLTCFSAVPQDPVYQLPTLRYLSKWWMQIYGQSYVMDSETTKAEEARGWVKL